MQAGILQVGRVFSQLSISRVGGAGCGYVAARIAIQGLSNVLALDTLRHGSSFHGYIGIRLFGGIPARGGTAWGASHTRIKSDRSYEAGKFFLATDPRTHPPGKGIPGNNRVFVRLMPKMFTFLSSAGERSSCRGLYPLQCVWGAVAVVCVPTVSFHVTPDWVEKNLVDDERCTQIACYSERWVDPFHIGLVGVVRNGVNPSWLRRVYHHPGKLASGVIQLTVVTAVMSLALRMVPRAECSWVRYAVIAGLIL